MTTTEIIEEEARKCAERLRLKSEYQKIIGDHIAQAIKQICGVHTRRKS
jgi:hypothetical protein